MADQEVIKHTKKVYKIWNSKQHSLLHKLKEFAIEILIIVFAVTLSIQLHSWSEHSHEQKQVKSFLLGLKDDIKADLSDVESIKKSYEKYTEVYTYLSLLDRTSKPNLDTLRAFLPHIRTNDFLRVHQTRFNGFLSSGKILTIEDDSLAFMILNYYQEIVPMLKSSENGWISANTNLNDYLMDNLKDTSAISYWEVLATPKAKYLSKTLIPWQQLKHRYENITSEGKKIIERINDLYPNAK